MPQQDFLITPATAEVRYGSASAPTPQQNHPKLDEGAPLSLTRMTADISSPVAMLVCHGMGQQVRYETLGQVAASVLKYASGQGCKDFTNTVHLSQQENSFLARAELSWKESDDTEHHLHIYEAYWAPVTEGKVTYRDTVTFLLSAAWKGIHSSRLFKTSIFKRYLFGAMRNLTISKMTMVGLLITAVFVIAQVAAIALVLAKLADQLKQIELVHFAFKQILIIMLPGIHTLADTRFTTNQHIHVAAAIVGWYALVAEIFFVRYFLVQYAGDVAAYISPYKSSKFEDIRNRIQSIGLNVAKVIYGFENTTPVPDYQRVVIVGHSLGSVLAYDTLNAVLNLDETSAHRHAKRVLERTSKLITFGSPLDKTAFLFRNQSNDPRDPLREQMVSSLQPLILDKRFRSKPDFWTNLYSRMDIISGKLDYYDLPGTSGSAPYPVVNLPDPDASIPFYAHVQYWNGTLLAKTLYDAVQ
jgi:hypothetical protein